MRAALFFAALLIVVVTVVLRTCCYVVDEREQAVLVQFGDPILQRTEPGLYFKVPFVQEVRYLPKTRQLWGGTPSDLLPDLPTKDGKKVEVTPWAVWRITDPIAFVKVLREKDNARERVKQFTRNAVRDIITQYDLVQLVRSTDRKLTYTFAADLTAEENDDVPKIAIEQPEEANAKVTVGRPVILEAIKEQAKQRLSAGNEGSRGIEIIDVGVSRIEFVDSVQRAAFERLRKFMESIAAYYTNDGERQKQAIINRTKAEVQKIEGQGKQISNETRGRINAELIREYAAAIEQTGDFYIFLKTLEAARAAIRPDTRLLLTTDNPLANVLKQAPATDQQPPAPPVSTSE